MKKSRKSINIESVIITLLLVFLIIMLSFSVYLLVSYNRSLAEQTENRAMTASLAFISEVNAKSAAAARRTTEIAEAVGEMTAEEEIIAYFKRTVGSGAVGVSHLRFFDGGKEYNSSGLEIENKEPESVSRLINAGKAGCAGLVYLHDSYTTSAYIAFYAPVSGNPLIDGLLTYFTPQGLLGEMASFFTGAADEAEHLVVCAADGTIFFEMGKEEFTSAGATNLYTYLREKTNDKISLDLLRNAANKDGSGVSSYKIDGEDFALALAAAEATDGTIYISGLYRATSLFGEGYGFIANISVALAVSLIVIAAGTAYLMRMRRRSLEEIKSYDTIDPILGCNTYKKFALDAEDILERNKITKFAIIYTEINQFRFITESFETINSDDILRFLAKVFGMSMLEDETYGHINDDKFALLLHYSDEDDLMNRLRVIYAIVYNYPEMKKLKSNLKLSIGVFCIDRTVREPIQKMLDRAVLAEKTNTHNTTEEINIYDERVKSNFMREAEIESRKEAALENNEFRVFYQPKYNILQNRPDGAEALVRWYDVDTNTFRNPAEFVPIFEANGFIGKLDRYVYVEVCKYISESVERGYRVVPMSVNVSHVTATQEGFVDFYIRTKKKYNIADSFLTVEFTESFAFENYEVLKEIIRRLQANGIRCSIDDFGSGYSSYNILKEMQMDELKLDKFFITKGFSQERDNELLRTIISLAKNFGMKVTQEGVETVDTLERLEEYGCDVIQGYYYSKPLSLDDYIIFLNNGGTLKRF